MAGVRNRQIQRAKVEKKKQGEKKDGKVEKRGAPKAPSKKEKHSKTRKFWPGNGGLKKVQNRQGRNVQVL